MGSMRSGLSRIGVWCGIAALGCAVACVSSAPNVLAATGPNATLGTPALAGPSSQTRYLALGDFTGDGLLDSLVLDSAAHALLVSPGNGDGTFGAPVSTTLVGSAFDFVGVAAADVNRDGKLDAIALDSWSHEVSVSLGNGNGTFAFGTTYSTAATPQSIAIADMTGDSILDLVVGMFDGGVEVMPGTGTGSFATGTAVATSAATIYQLAVGDIDGDGDLDVGTANYGTHAVGVLTNNGSGTLTLALSVDLTTYNANVTRAYGIASGDFTGTGQVQFAVTTSANASTSGVAIVNPLTGAISGYLYDATPGFATTSDVNMDGNVDVVTAWTGLDTAVIWYGNGDGTFRTPPQATTVATGNMALNPLAGDLDRNGVPDVVVGLLSLQFSVVLNLTPLPRGPQAPPDWVKQVGRLEKDACPAGWHPSWAQWPNDHTGGFVCEQVLRWTPAGMVAL